MQVSVSAAQSDDHDDAARRDILVGRLANTLALRTGHPARC